jgi:hypothetical protein
MTRFDASFGGKTEIKDVQKDEDKMSYEYGPIFSFWLVPSYKLTDVLSAGMDLGMDIHTGDTAFFNGKEQTAWNDLTTYNDFGLSPWVDLQIGGGRMRIGVVVMFPGSFRDKPEGNGYVTPKFLGDPVISVPISITYSF